MAEPVRRPLYKQKEILFCCAFRYSPARPLLPEECPHQRFRRSIEIGLIPRRERRARSARVGRGPPAGRGSRQWCQSVSLPRARGDWQTPGAWEIVTSEFCGHVPYWKGRAGSPVGPSHARRASRLTGQTRRHHVLHYICYFSFVFVAPTEKAACRCPHCDGLGNTARSVQISFHSLAPLWPACASLRLAPHRSAPQKRDNPLWLSTRSLPLLSTSMFPLIKRRASFLPSSAQFRSTLLEGSGSNCNRRIAAAPQQMGVGIKFPFAVRARRQQRKKRPVAVTNRHVLVGCDKDVTRGGGGVGAGPTGNRSL